MEKPNFSTCHPCYLIIIIRDNFIASFLWVSCSRTLHVFTALILPVNVQVDTTVLVDPSFMEAGLTHREAEWLVPAHKGWEQQSGTLILSLAPPFSLLCSPFGSALMVSWWLPPNHQRAAPLRPPDLRRALLLVLLGSTCLGIIFLGVPIMRPFVQTGPGAWRMLQSQDL